MAIRAALRGLTPRPFVQGAGEPRQALLADVATGQQRHEDDGEGKQVGEPCAASRQHVNAAGDDSGGYHDGEQ